MDLREVLKQKRNQIAMENIHYQLDNSRILAIEELFLSMRDDIKKLDPKKAYLYYNKTEFKEKLNKLEKLLEEQFNIEFIVGFNKEADFFSSWGAGRIPHGETFRINWKSTMTEWGEGGAFQEMYNDISEAAKDAEITKETEREYKAFLNLSIFGNHELIKVILEEGLKLDLKNVRFINKPKKLKFYINLDFIVGCSDELLPMYKGFFKAPLEIKEFTAIMLHEIGHSWDFIYSLFKLGQDVDVLQDVVRECVAKGNKDLPTIVELYYTRQGINKKPSSNPVKCMIELEQTIVEGYSDWLASGRHVKNNVEQQADEFASRFGYGVYIPMGLAKFPTYDAEDSIIKGNLFNCLQLEVLALAGIFSLGLGAIVTTLLTIVVAPAIAFLLTYLSLRTLGHGYYGANYDNLYRRAVRTKNATIRRLKFIENTEIKDNILAQLEDFDKTLKALKAIEDSRKLKKLTEKLAIRYREDKRDHAVAEFLEDLNSNDVYVSYEKIRQLQRSIK